jgi:6-phosphogluconate dehydrogenase
MNRVETIEFINGIIEKAIDEAKDNGTDNPNFILNCTEALEFIKAIESSGKEYISKTVKNSHVSKKIKDTNTKEQFDDKKDELISDVESGKVIIKIDIDSYAQDSTVFFEVPRLDADKLYHQIEIMERNTWCDLAGIKGEQRDKEIAKQLGIKYIKTVWEEDEEE